MAILAAMFAGIVTVAIVFQVVNGRNSPTLAKTFVGGTTSVVRTLFSK